MRTVLKTGVALPYECDIEINGQHRRKKGMIYPHPDGLIWKARRIAVPQKKSA